jgi:hypothetical protein
MTKKKKAKKTKPAVYVTFDVDNPEGLHALRVFLYKTKLTWDASFIGEEFTILSRPRFAQ